MDRRNINIMPYMNLYKLDDGKWHLSEHVEDPSEILESKRVGGRHNEKCPPWSELCGNIKCFKHAKEEYDGVNIISEELVKDIDREMT